MDLLWGLLMVCFLYSHYVPLTWGYMYIQEVNYDDPYYNDISEGEQPKEETTPSPCSSDPTKWDKLFSMLESSQMRENMMIEHGDDLLKMELQSLRSDIMKLMAGYAGACASQVDGVGRRLTAQLDQQLAEALAKNGCPNGAGAKAFYSEHKEQDTITTEGRGVEKMLATMVTGLQNLQAQLDLSLRSKETNVLTSGCEMALLFPMRSRRIYASVTPDGPMALNTFTVCLWARPTETLNKTVLFSYGTRSNPHEIQLLFSKSSALFTVGGEAHLVEAHGVVQPGQWGHYCGVWSSEQGLASLWVNGLQVAGSPGVAEDRVLPHGGIIQLAQEKNGCCEHIGFEVGFDAKLAFAGKMTGVNMWDRALNAEEISYRAQQDAACPSRGNVIGWGVSEIIPHGGAQFIG